jgi:hypothetical protein
VIKDPAENGPFPGPTKWLNDTTDQPSGHEMDLHDRFA